MVTTIIFLTALEAESREQDRNEEIKYNLFLRVNLFLQRI